jgi:hypothetical protein
MSGASLQYIRDYYRVPATRGGIVRVRANARVGTIAGTDQQWLRVHVDGHAGNYHPYDLDYLVDGDWIASEPIRAAHDRAWDRFNRGLAESTPG